MGEQTKHTPGVWRLCNDGICSCLTVSCSDHPIAQIVNGEWGDEYPTIKVEGPSLNAKAVAVMERIVYGEIPKTVAIANARLIAAAPELLEALKDARRQLEDYERERTGEHYNDQRINAAIAKATGGPDADAS